jgi:hypothetical protein
MCETMQFNENGTAFAAFARSFALISVDLKVSMQYLALTRSQSPFGLKCTPIQSSAQRSVAVALAVRSHDQHRDH